MCVLVPPIVFHHVCQFNDKLALLVFLTGLKSMFLCEGRAKLSNMDTTNTRGACCILCPGACVHKCCLMKG